MSPTHTTDSLIAYASAEWNKSTLPAELFAGQRVPEHTWARYTLHTGSLKIRELSAQNDIIAEHELCTEQPSVQLAPDSEYQLAQASDDVRVQLDYHTTAAHYISLRYGLTATHSEVIRAVEQHHVAPCKTLDMGAGQGRNALYLALQGFDVTIRPQPSRAARGLRLYRLHRNLYVPRTRPRARHHRRYASAHPKRRLQPHRLRDGHARLPLPDAVFVHLPRKRIARLLRRLGTAGLPRGTGRDARQRCPRQPRAV